MRNHITADIKFAIIPDWVLDASVSDRAIRVYCILARYADNETLQAFPSRDTLARRANCNAKAITRAVDELVAIGAVIKEHRKSGDAYQSNLYTLRRVGPDLTLGRDNGDPGVGSDLTPGRVSDVPLTRTTELEPINDNHLTISADKSARTNRPHRLPEDWYPSQRLLDMFPEKWPSLDPEYEIENFINYWLGEGKPKADWDRTFQGWMSRNEKQSKPRGGAGYRKPTAAERTAQLIHGARAKDEEELITKGIGRGPDFGYTLKGIDG